MYLRTPTFSGGMGHAATVVYRRLAAVISEKHEKHLLHCRLSFSLVF